MKLAYDPWEDKEVPNFGQLAREAEAAFLDLAAKAAAGDATAVKAMQNPDVILHSIVESIPLMLAGGALAGAGVALVFPGLLVGQIVVAIMVALLMLYVTRPALLKRLQQAVIANHNVFAVLMDAVRSCSLGQITNALFEVGGQYRRSM